MSSWRALRVMGWCAVVCLALAACSAPWRAGAPTTTPTATAVVAATAPSDPHDYTCPGPIRPWRPCSVKKRPSRLPAPVFSSRARNAG